MRKIYSCIDIGSHSTKLLIMEKIQDRFVVLSRYLVKTKGIKKGLIQNEEEVILSIKNVIGMAEADLGIQIREILCLIPCDNAFFSMVSGETPIVNTVTKEDISKVLQNAVKGKVEEDKLLVSVSPVLYNIDQEENKKEVLGEIGSELTVKAVIATIPKARVRSYFNIFKRIGIKVVDIGFHLVGDYYATKDSATDQSTTAIINIGYDATEVGIFNKGILIKAEKIDVGSRYIDKDIACTYNLERKKVRYLKETFAVSNTRYADVNEIITISDKDENNITINQLKISEIVENRLSEILKFAKKQISILTNREIRYIIVTGGISELAGFSYILENIYGRCASVLNMDKMGVRSNSFSSCVGFIEYFSEKLDKQDKAYSMISDEELESITRKTRKTTGDGGLGVFLNYFTGNKED